MKKMDVGRIFWYISIALFVIALTQRTYCTSSEFYGTVRECNPYGSGFTNLLMGWLGLIAGIAACIAWLANPFLIASWVLPRSLLTLRIIFCAVAFLLSLSFLLFDKILLDEAGNMGKIVGYGFGYWLWTVSSVVFLIGNLYILIFEKG